MQTLLRAGKQELGTMACARSARDGQLPPSPRSTEKPTDGGEQGQGRRTGLWSCSQVPRSS